MGTEKQYYVEVSLGEYTKSFGGDNPKISTENDYLYIKDDNGLLAIFAPGSWSYAKMEELT